MDKQTVEKLISLGEIKSFKPAEIIFEEGASSDYFCYLLEGKVIVEKQAGPNDYINILTIVSKEFFGEMALFDSGKRLARARAVEPSKIVLINRDAFFNFLNNKPKEGLGVFVGVTEKILERIGHTNRQMSCFYQLSRLVSKIADAKDFIVSTAQIIFKSFSFNGVSVSYYNEAVDKYETIYSDGIGSCCVRLPKDFDFKCQEEVPSAFGINKFNSLFLFPIDVCGKIAAIIIFLKQDKFNDNEKGFLSAVSPHVNSCLKDIFSKNEQKNIERLKQVRYQF